MSGRWFCRWFCPILIIVLVIVLWRWPWRPSPVTPVTGEPAPTTTGAANLVLEHVDAATWAPTNNRFHHAGTVSEDSSYFWTGFLVQVGNFPDVDYVLDSLALYDATGAVVYSSRLADGDPFVWINIVGSWKDLAKSPTPLDPDEAFWLFPNRKVADGCGGSDAVVGPGEVSDVCKRGRQLHPDMERVRAVISYWQGPGGFTAKSTQAPGTDGLYRTDKKFEFWFGDAFEVQAWELVESTDGDHSKDRFDRVSIPAVTRVVVSAKPEGGSTEGKTQEPPWWYP